MLRSPIRTRSAVHLLITILILALAGIPVRAQVAVCGTPGIDGPVNVAVTINTYYPASGTNNLPAASTSVVLAAVPATDAFGNSFGTTPISAGDLLLIYQVQAADIDVTNSNLYGSGTTTSGPDGLGGTGFTNLNNTGRYEFLVATSDVPLTGGTLTFRGGGAGSGTVYNYVNQDGTALLTQKRFQVVRVPQFSNLTLTSSLVCPPWNGYAGGIVAFDVAGDFAFGGYTINANGRGFRAGYQDIAGSGTNLAGLYVTSTYDQASGKGENIAGTPRYMWDGFNAVDNGAAWNGFPGGDYGKGAPGNGGGGGNDHNAGGGGGSNGGAGGEGGIGWQGGGGTWPNGGRPGAALAQVLGRLYLGGGGGGGDANNALTGVKGGVGGGLVVINAGRISGTGTINANGDNGDVGAYGSAPDGAGGGGAGGTIFLNITQNSPTANLTLNAIGGNGGNTLNDSGFEHGPGGGGGGGSIWYNATGAAVATNVVKGVSGKANGGAGIVHGAVDGLDGTASTFAFASLPVYLQGQSSTCYPTITTAKTSFSAQNSVGVPQGANTTYTIAVTNNGAAGNAGGVRVEDFLPSGITYVIATAAYSGGAAGPGTLTNLGTAAQPVFGDFNVPNGGTIDITLTVLVSASLAPGTYHNGAQVSWLDPTRTLADPSRRISPATDSYPGANTTYEVGGTPVPGSNYSNAPAGPVAENVLVLSYPVANDDAFTMNEDGTLANTVKTNDSDADDTVLSLVCGVVSGGSAAANGALTLNANGTFTYTPNADFNGTVSFTYQSCDNDGLCDPATVTIVINPVNDAPTGNDDGFTTNEDAALTGQSVTGNDSDADNTIAQLTWALVSGGTAATNGTLVFNANGTFDWTPNSDFNGTVSFTYSICDPGPLCDNTNTVTITVAAVNDAPVANDDGFNMNEDASLTAQSVTGNDSDGDNTNAQLTWGLVSGGTASANGTLLFNANGTFNYTPNANYNGTVSFTYQVCDPGAACDPATVTITVNAVNDAPAANDDTFTTAEDVALSASVAGNDSDVDNTGAQLTWSLLSGGTAAANGTLNFTATGGFTWTPTLDFTGTVSFTYQLCDPSSACDPATVTITVGSANDAPVANDDAFTTSEDVALIAQSVTGNDSDPDGDALAYSLVSGGTATANGTLVFNANGTFNWTPAINFNGTVTFTYQTCDPSSVCDAATVTITVNTLNDAPVAGDDVFSTNEEFALVGQSVTGNDSDVDNTNAQLTWSLVSGGTAATNGTLALNASGTFNWTPNADYNGTVSFTYQVCDPSSACDPATVTITVTAVNDAPTANDDSYTTTEDVALTAQSVAGNDSDPDNTAAQLTWSLLSGGTAAANGTLVFNANGTFNWTPVTNYNGTVTFTYQVCDPSSACDAATVTITVVPANDAPIGNDDAFTMNEDATLGNTVATNDTDLDNTSAQLGFGLVSGGTAAANGALVLNADGTFTYTPNADYNGTVSFTYQVCDPGPACDPATVTITINAVNDPPTAADDTFTMTEDGVLNNAVGPNDSDPDHTVVQLTWSLLSGGTAAANGTLSFNADGTFTYAPAVDFNGSVSFTYQLCDPNAACDPATATITITPANDTPVALDDSFTINEDTPLSNTVGANDSDVETPGATLVWSLVGGGTAAANGTLALNPDGTFTWAPNADFNGTVTFTYQVCDPGPACDPATVTITVAPVNDAPVANDDGFSTAEDVAVSNTVGGNDSDADNTSGQLTWALLSGGTAAMNGTLVFNGDGTFSWTPDTDFNGTVTFTYTLCDPGNACDNATVTIIVGGANDAPVANDDAFSTPEDNTLNANVTGNDMDADGDALTFTVVNGGTAAANGTLTLNPDGTFSYAPNAHFNGPVSFTYQACDPGAACDPATVTITVTPVNDAPVANDDSFTTNEDVALTGTVGGNDSDTETPNASLSWALVSGGTAAANGLLALNNDGTFSYTPSADFNGTVSFTYQVCDPSGTCDPATVTITVTPVNDTPTANDDAFTMNEDGTLTAQSVTGNDSDTETSNGSLVWSLVSGGTAVANGTLVFNANGTFNYTPNADFNGTVTYTYQLCDPGNACDNAAVIITVNAVNDVPIANDDAFAMPEDGSLSNTVAGNDSDPEGGALTFALVSGGTAAGNGALVLNADGTFTFVPDGDYNGTVSFTYGACDQNGACDQATVTITVTPVNDPPFANDDSFTMNEDAVLANSTGGNDSDIDNTNAQLTWSLVSGGTAAANGALVLNADGTFTWAPNTDFIGSVSFTYQVCDPSNACDNAVVTVNVTAVNDAPTANDDAFTMNEDGTLTAQSVTGNDSDPDNANAALTWSLVNGGTAATNGTLVFNADGTFNYTPTPDFNGTVSFTYQVCDPGNTCDNATVTIIVNAVNDGPVANDDIFGVIEDGTLTTSVTGNDSDIDHTNAQLTWSLLSGGTAEDNGAVSFNADGTFTYVPDAGFNGTVNFTYQVCDPAGLCDAATVTILVGSDNDAPIAGDDAFLTNEDNAINSAVTGGDSDADGDALTWNLVSAGTAAVNGTLVFNADGSFSWTPNADYNGVVTFIYQACDPLLFCDGATVTITVLPVNDAPVANDDNFTIPEDGTLTNAVSGNDSDVEGGLTWSLTNGGSAAVSGTLSFNTDGTFTWAPNADFNGTATFTYQACDGDNACDDATVTINVTPANDAPAANDDAFTMNEDASLSGTVAGNDSDADNTSGQLTWSLVNGGSAAANGTLIVNANGSFTYVPNADYNGSVSFTYQVCDPGASCDPATVTINVLPVNDGPIANDDNYAMDESSGLTSDLGVNDSDIDGDPLTWSLVDGMSAAANGTLNVNADGNFSYTSDPGFNGTVSFTYQVCDGDGLCDDALVIMNIGAVNDAPDVNDDVTTTPEDTPVTIDVLANDSDSDGGLDESTVTITIPPGHGTVTVNVDGTITYAPGTDYIGVDAFQYQVCDDGTPLPAECATGFVDITVLPLNDAPTAFDDGYAILEDGGTLNADVTGNDYDIDDANNTLIWSLTNGGTAAENGTLVFNADGTFTYTPNANYYGFVSFSYQLCDPAGQCEGAAVFINVLPVNDPPIALGDVDNTLPDVPLTTNVSANDNDTIDLSIIDLGSISIIVPPDSGSITVNGNGTVTYTPDPGFIGNDTLIYQICDVGVPLPALCDTAILIIIVTDAFPLAIDDNYSLPEDSLLVMDVLDNDTTINGTLDPTTVTVINGPFQGTATVNPDGTITYAPDPDYYGPDAFNYTVCTDLGFCSNATVLINVDAVNDPPMAENDTIATDEDAPVTFSVVGNDSDLADGALGGIDSLSVTIAIAPIDGTASVNVDGTITYTPGTDFNSIDSLQYQVCDLGYPLPAECDTAWVIITVGDVNDPPVITDQVGAPIDTLTVTTPEDVPLQICFNAIDPEGDTLDATNSFLGPDFGIITGEADGDTCITYTPDPDYNGGDTVTVVVCDNGLCDTVVVVIDVTPVNDPPVVVDVIGNPSDTVTTTTPEDTPIAICLDAIDIDGDPVEVSGVITGPQNGTATGLADGDTCWTYTPDPDFNGTDTVTVQVCDNNGGCDTVLVIIDVTPVNDDPVIIDGTGTSVDTLNVFTLEDIPVYLCLNVDDVDGDAVEASSVPYGPFDGTVTGLQDGDTCFTYTPDPGFIGVDTLIAVVSDGQGGTDTVVVIVTTLESNDPPTIVDGGGIPIDTVEITTPEDTPVQLCLDAIDPEGLPVDITAITPIDLNGGISGISDGDTCITYTPFPNYNGTDTLYVFVCDGFGACDSVLAIIDVTPVNDPPVITDPGFVPIDTIFTSTPTGTPLMVCLEALDVDGDTLDVTFVSIPGDGLISALNDGDTCFTYTSDPGFIGVDTVTAVVCDPNGGCDSVVVIIDVTSPNNPPIIVDENFADADTLGFTTPEDTPITICLTAIDFDGDTLDVTGIFGGPSNGFANGIGDGDTCFTYTPVPDWNGTDTLSAIVCDDNGGCDTVLVIIEVTPVNDPPMVVDGGGTATDTLNTTTPQGIPVTICPPAIDIDGDTLDVTGAISGPANGAITDIADGDTCFTYTPDPGFIGTDTVIVTVCDNAGACDTVVVIIDVTPLNPNEPPIAVDDTATTAIGTAVTVSILDNDSDPDGDALTVTSAVAGNGTVVINTDGTVTYTPDSGFCGIDTIAYTVCDPFLACDDAIVVVDVPCPPDNDPPIAVDDAASTSIGTAITVPVLDNDSDPNGDPITVTSSSASNGTVVINGDGTITYTPTPFFCGTDTIFYTICDPGPLCDEAIVLVDVPCPPDNDPPIAVDDSTGFNGDGVLVIDVLDNDSDPDGDPLTVTNAEAANGTVTIGGNGELYYTSDDGFCGIDTITYTVCDPEPLCDEAYVFVTVECPDTSDLAIPEGFSPNNDGYGDTWTIAGLERYPLAKVTIFNRWGNEVYSADPYGNDWDGRSANALTWDGVLPVGTYWYLLDLGMEGEEVRTGYIYLNR